MGGERPIELHGISVTLPKPVAYSTQHLISTAAGGRLENLKDLIRSMEEFGVLQGFLEHTSLVMDDEEAAAEGAVNHEVLECRRCPTRVVEMANALIARNRDREPRKLAVPRGPRPGR